MTATNDRAFSAEDWVALQCHLSAERDDWDADAEYTALALDYADLYRAYEQLQGRNCALEAHASALTVERDRAEREACGLRRWRDIALVYLGAGSLVLGRLRGEGRR